MDILGTIIASTLNYDQLCTQLKERPAFDAGKSTYAPCDGRSVVGSDYSEVTKEREAIDLRGRFLRGLNVIYGIGQRLPFNPKEEGDPEVTRQMGDYQADAFKSHTHQYTDRQEGNGPNQADDGNDVGFSKIETKTTSGTGGEETRPRNVAVYYYMRINC